MPAAQNLPRFRGRSVALSALLFVSAAAQATPARLTEPAVRAFVARQEAAWNGRDATAWAGFFTPDARFVDQALGSDNKVVVNGTGTLAQTIAQARRFFARSTFRETSTIERIEIAADGLSALAFAQEVSRIETPGRPARTLCARTEQTLVLEGGRIRSRGQTDTAVRCDAK